VSTSAATTSDILLVTIESVPGREIQSVFGAVLGHGDCYSGTSRNRVALAREQAINELRSKAASLGADAVVGLTVTVSGVRGFWGFSLFAQSAVVQASGTAVKLKN